MTAQPLRIGDVRPAAPVVLAPMAGVTNAAFRGLCRSFAPGLIYVNEMVMASAVVHRNAKTERMMTFTADESPRSLQVYGSDPAVLGDAVRRLCDEGRVDHVDLNFGCPAAKVTRKGGGAAVPATPNLLRAVVRAAVTAAEPFGVPVTAKFRMGLFDRMLTHVRTGLICEDEGVAWVALHARTAEQHYAGDARWDAIGELKAAVHTIPVLGNGDIWAASDALDMVRATGCDGVVVGRGCLGRPWLFRDLVDAFAGRPAREAPALGDVVAVLADHARRLIALHASHADEGGHVRGARHGAEWLAMRELRKHTSWYVTGYPVGSDARRRLAMVSTLAELDDLLGALDPSLRLVPGGERIRRGHANGPIRVALPDGFLHRLDDVVIPDDDAEMAVSGG